MLAHAVLFSMCKNSQINSFEGEKKQVAQWRAKRKRQDEKEKRKKKIRGVTAELLHAAISYQQGKALY